MLVNRSTTTQVTDGAGRQVLTDGEQRVAILAACGRRNGEIARELELSPKTVEWNLTRVYRKLGVRSRTELAVRLAAGDSPWTQKPQ
jgi:DNA-binding NarL/FixJ family response regulator